MLFERTFIFDADAAHPSCHASVICELPNGELMAAWYAGKSEAHKTVAIKASWKPLAGGSWSPPVVIHKTPGRADGNAVLAWYRDELYLFYCTIHGLMFPWFNTIVYLKKSRDFGRTWSESIVILPDAPKGITVRNKPLLVGSRLLIPVGNEHLRRAWSNIIITEDGVHFRLSQPILLPHGRNEQPTIVRLGDGRLLGFLRTNRNGVWRTSSSDNGDTWSTPEVTSLQNPNSALDFVRTPAGELALAWNNNPRKGSTMSSRQCLHVGYSPDEGQTWPIIKEVEREGDNGSFSYPSIILGSDGVFHLTYSYYRRRVRYVRFDREWLLQQGESKGL